MATVLLTGNDRKTAQKLHKQFGHPTAKKLIDLLHKADIKEENLEKEIHSVSANCEACVRYKRPSPRPIVSIPLANKFNESVAMDLKVWEGKYLLVMVDLATRYCAAAVVHDKQAKTIIKAFFGHWIAIFGAPTKILSDNGCEFNNSHMRELGEKFNIEVLTTAAESPWSNGVCERLNAVIGDTVSKIMTDRPCDVDTALAWAVSARNSLLNNNGFSPNQLVFAYNPSIPDVFHSDPPALESVSSSDIVRMNLNALHAARIEFQKCESSEKIRRALRCHIRETKVTSLQNGDKVFYKQIVNNAWHGPGIVIGRDGIVVLVRHGGTYVRVHVCRLVGAFTENDSAVEESLNLSGKPDKGIEDKGSR